MGMVAAYQVGSLIYSQTSQCHLIGIRDGFLFISPVEDYNDKLSTLGFHLCDVVF